MSKSRNIADLLDSSGDVKSGALDNVPASDDASSLTTGTIPIARIADDAVVADKLANSINTDIATGVTANTTANAALPKAGGAMTGAITTNSTFDGVDIATRDGVLTTTTTTADAALPRTGGGSYPMTGHLRHADNVKGIYGDGVDLQIYHDGSNSFIDEVGSGVLQIRSNDIYLQKYTGETMIRGVADGAAELFYDSSKKLATTSTGVDITGAVTVNGSALASGGITEADQWRLTTSFAGDASPISSNLERNDTDFEKIGTGMSQSSGIFSFPSTGKWQVSFQAQQYSNHTEDYGVYLIKVTTDNSQYEPRCKIVTGTSTAVTFSSGYGNCIVDVTDTSNVKVKFDVFQAASSNKAYAHSDYNYTAMTFLKLGET